MNDTTNMNDHEVAVAYRAALAAYHADPDAWEDLIELENELCGRLDLPLDETEQGLTTYALARIDAFVEWNDPRQPATGELVEAIAEQLSHDHGVEADDDPRLTSTILELAQTRARFGSITVELDACEPASLFSGDWPPTIRVRYAGSGGHCARVEITGAAGDVEAFVDQHWGTDRSDRPAS